MKSMIMISTKIMTNTIIIVLIIHQVQSQLMTCPQVCSCIWRNGKQTTICENQNLISIPNQISQSTQVLDLNQNNFQILPSKAFQERGLINLQKLFIPKCKLGAIADDAFYQLTNLVELDLSDNLLTHVPIKALANATNLRRLLLNNNHIATITAESFTSLSSLKFLNLSGCKTHTIEARAFYGLRDLEYLYLHDNKLTTLPYAVVSDLPALYSFELYRNPWQCNCEMRPTREWMIRNNVGQSIPATCDLPIRLSGLMWNSLDIDDFACEPDIITTTVEVAKVVGSNATLSCTVKGIPEPKVFWYLDHGSYNISSQRSNKYHLHEERSEGIINSLLTIINLDNSDDSTSFICSAENRAGIKSKNFTVYVLQSGAFMVPSNWSKIELAGSILGLLLTLVVAFVLITLILIRSKRLPFYGVCSNKKSSESSRNNSNKSNNSPMDSLEKKKSLNQLFAQHFHQNGTAIHPATNTNGTSITYQQYALSMLGIDGIDKKPEIFLKPDLLVPGTLDNNNKMDNNNQSNIMINGNNNLTGYEMNHFNTNHNQINGHLTFSNDVLNGNQDTLFVNNEESVPNFQHQQQQMSGLYRAVMVNPTTVITDNNVNGGLALSSSTTMTTANAPQTNSSIMTYNTSTTANATPPPVIMNNLQSQPNLLFAATTPTATQYLSQFELNNQLVPPQSNAQFYTQQQSLPNQNRQALPDSSPSPLLISYGNPAFISDSAASINGFICMDTNNNNSNMNNATTTMMYNDMNGDDDEVFRATINKPIILEPLPSLFTQLPSRPNTTATMITNNNSLSRPNLLAMEESLYGIRRTTIPTPINPIQQPSFVTMAPMQMAPPAPTINQQQQSIYGITTANSSKSRWQTMTPNFPFRNQQPYPSMTATTSLSNIRYSPDEGYGEESSTGGSAGNSGAAAANNNGATVGQLQGTEV